MYSQPAPKHTKDHKELQYGKGKQVAPFCNTAIQHPM